MNYTKQQHQKAVDSVNDTNTQLDIDREYIEGEPIAHFNKPNVLEACFYVSMAVAISSFILYSL